MWALIKGLVQSGPNESTDSSNSISLLMSFRGTDGLMLVSLAGDKLAVSPVYHLLPEM